MKGGVVHNQVVGGVDTASPGHLIADTRWTTVHNVRPFRGAITQVPRRVQQATLAQSTPLQLITNLSTGQADRALMVGLTKSKAYQLRPLSTTHPELLVNGATGTFVSDSTYRRWASCMYSGQMWFLNDLNPLYFTDGSQVKSYPTVPLPKARYVEAFYDHLVVGNYTLRNESRPNGILSSGLYDPRDWVTTAENEVMRIDFEEFALPDFPLIGLTGLRRLGKLLIAYMPTAVIALAYVGLPKIYQWESIGEGVGNALPYGLASHGNTHFFFDGCEVDFFSLTAGQGIKSIGERISSYFVESLNTDPDLAARTWSFIWREMQEVWWVYVSEDSDGAFDKAIGYSWRSGEWFTADVEDLHSFGGFARRAKTCDELTGTCDQLGSVNVPVWLHYNEVDTLSNSGEAMCPRIWGEGTSKILREAVGTDDNGVLVPQGDPELITKDYDYGSPDVVKEVDSVLIDADYGGLAVGIDVYVSARRYANDAVVFKKVGRWTKNIEEGRLTFDGLSGVYFRYKFIPIGAFIRDFRWTARVDGVYDGKADK